MELNILDLNDYCLGSVLKYLGQEDHVRFAQTCKRFEEVLRDWSPVLYPDLKIERSYITSSNEEKLQFQLLYTLRDVIKRLYLKFHEEDDEAPFFIDDLVSQIKYMDSLEYIEIKVRHYCSPLDWPKTRQHLIEKVLDALEFLPNVKNICVRCNEDTYTVSSLKRMNCLEIISIDNKISVDDLIEICKSNTNLRVLWIRRFVGELSDIVPHCQNLEEISFHLFKSPARLADLPKLRKVIIQSKALNSPCPELIELFDAFAEKKQQTVLESLMLFFSLDLYETSKLIQLTSLKELGCAFKGVRCINLLTELTELEGLYIILKSLADGSKKYLNILRSCQKLQHLHINSTVSIKFTGKALKVLRQVRKPEKQKPLQFYSEGVRHLYNDKGEKEIDNEYCVVGNWSEYLRATPWRSDLYQIRHCAKRSSLQKTIWCTIDNEIFF